MQRGRNFLVEGGVCCGGVHGIGEVVDSGGGVRGVGEVGKGGGGRV